MDKLLVICGPTATGKTSLGIKLAKKFNGEIISADSRQVYKGLDIGTGKDITKLSIFNSQFSIRNLNIGYYKINNIKIWLLDMVSPRCKFSVADWLIGVDWVLNYLKKKNKLPIIVGGTGFYLRSLVEGIDTLGVKHDKKLRKKLNKLSLEELQKKLQELSPEIWQQLNNSDKNNSYRLIRKIEIAEFHGIPYSRAEYPGEILQIGLKTDLKKIYRKIDRRVEQRLSDGLLKEIKNLIQSGVNWDDPGMNTLAYKEFKPYFEDGENLEKVVQKWKYDEHGYARRQLTWFNKNKNIKWFDIKEKDFNKICVIIKQWLKWLIK